MYQVVQGASGGQEWVVRKGIAGTRAKNQGPDSKENIGSFGPIVPTEKIPPKRALPRAGLTKQKKEPLVLWVRLGCVGVRRRCIIGVACKWGASGSSDNKRFGKTH